MAASPDKPNDLAALEGNGATTLDGWVRYISETEMPVFQNTANQIAAIMENPDLDAQSMAKLILRDPNLTAKVLKMANSSFYNPGGMQISTATRAVMMLGVDAIVDICLSITLVENFLRGSDRQGVLQHLARSLLTAHTARSLSSRFDEGGAEEAFVGGLLFNLGELALHCFAPRCMAAVQARLSKGDVDAGQAERLVLGFRSIQLTAELTRRWKLAPLLQEALRAGQTSNPRAEWLRNARDFAQATESGWKSGSVRIAVQNMARKAGLSVNDFARWLVGVVVESRDSARLLGNNELAERICEVPDLRTMPPEADVFEPSWIPPEPDPQMLLRIVQALKTLQDPSRVPDFQTACRLGMQGLHQGLGMDRAVVAFLQGNGTVYAIESIGRDAETLLRHFRFPHPDTRPSLLNRLLDLPETKAVLHQAENSPGRSTLPGSLLAVLGDWDFCVEALHVRHRNVGLVWADRGVSGREIPREALHDFHHVVQQMQAVLDRQADYPRSFGT